MYKFYIWITPKGSKTSKNGNVIYRDYGVWKYEYSDGTHVYNCTLRKEGLHSPQIIVEEFETYPEKYKTIKPYWEPMPIDVKSWEQKHRLARSEHRRKMADLFHATQQRQKKELDDLAYQQELQAKQQYPDTQHIDQTGHNDWEEYQAQKIIREKKAQELRDWFFKQQKKK